MGGRGQAELQPAEVTPPTTPQSAGHSNQGHLATKSHLPLNTHRVPSLQTPVQPALQPHEHLFPPGEHKTLFNIGSWEGKRETEGRREPAHPPRSGSGGPTRVWILSRAPISWAGRKLLPSRDARQSPCSQVGRDQTSGERRAFFLRAPQQVETMSAGRTKAPL